MMNRQIGIDCETAEQRIGLALAEFLSRGIRIPQSACRAKAGRAVDIIDKWARGHEPILLALNTPLG